MRGREGKRKGGKTKGGKKKGGRERGRERGMSELVRGRDGKRKGGKMESVRDRVRQREEARDRTSLK